MTLRPPAALAVQPIARQTTITAIGEACILGTIGIVLPFLLRHPQPVLGTAVNFALVYAALRCSTLAAVLPLVVLPSVAAAAGGWLFTGTTATGLLALIPAVWGGNLVLAVAVRRGRGAHALLAGSALKTLVIGLAAAALETAGLLVQGFTAPFVTVIFLTALLGGLAALPAAGLTQKWNARRRSITRGFTLVELLIVVAIIAILAAIATPNYLQASARSKVSRVRADMRTMNTAIEAYAVDWNYYPLNGVLNVGGTYQDPHLTPSGAPAHKFLPSAISTPVAYLTSIPRDPFIPENIPTYPAWQAYMPRYFYTNLDMFAKIMQPAVVPAIVQKKGLYGTWIVAGAGPDGDRLDLALDINYDPTNGIVSNGDIICSVKTGN